MGIKFGPIVIMLLAVFIAKISYDNYSNPTDNKGRSISSKSSKKSKK